MRIIVKTIQRNKGKNLEIDRISNTLREVEKPAGYRSKETSTHSLFIYLFLFISFLPLSLVPEGF